MHRWFWLSGILLLATSSFAQVGAKNSSAIVKPEHATPRPELALTTTIEVPSQSASSFFGHSKCDSDGNIYLKMDASGESGIRKFSPSGQAKSVFRLNAVPDLQVQYGGSFFVGLDGELYQTASVPNSLGRYVVVFDRDGNYKSAVKLDAGFVFTASQVAAFPSGELLVSGLRRDYESQFSSPFTAIFSSNGTLLRLVNLEGDQKLRDLILKGDERARPPDHPWNNSAVELGTAEPARDGNIYLMRMFSPAPIYAISAGGSVVRYFQVDPGDPKFMPIEMHISGSAIAILFRER